MFDLLRNARVSRTALSEFYQKMGMLLEAGYDLCSACAMLAERPENKRDRSMDGIVKIAGLLLPELQDGFSLYEAASKYPKVFGLYAKQIEVGEQSGQLSSVLKRMSNQIKESGKTRERLRSAVAYPAFVLIFTWLAAWYLFTNVVPDLLRMLTEVGVSDIPPLTQFVMDVGEWFGEHALLAFFNLLAIYLVVHIFSKTIGKGICSRIACSVPFYGRIVQHEAIATFYRNLEQMLLAGAEMSSAMQTAADAVRNYHIRTQLQAACEDYTQNGTPVNKTLNNVSAVRAMEEKAIQVALESNSITEILSMLAGDREFESDKAINRMVAATNPVLMLIVGAVVALIVMAIYGPIISMTSSPLL